MRRLSDDEFKLTASTVLPLCAVLMSFAQSRQKARSERQSLPFCIYRKQQLEAESNNNLQPRLRLTLSSGCTLPA